jgi:hypothetical protein
VVRWNKPSPFPPRAGAGGHAGAANTVQRARTEAVFTPNARILRPPVPAYACAEELLPGPGGGFQVRSAQRQTLSPPSGTFNFVRVHGDAPRARPVLVSTKLPHAQLAGGRPVVYAGTARFEQGEMAWWSNYSGTYQPIAAFRAQAGLPEDKFVPWQKLQMGGVSMQRGTFSERRAPGVPERAEASDGTGAERKSGGAAGRSASPASADRAKKIGSGGSKP